MILWPVIERELRAAARSKGTYRKRFLAALAVIGVTAWVIYERRWSPQNQIGQQVFESVSLTTLIVALIAGLFSTADSISEERREGTLGLLYLTDLRSGHVVLGKLVAHSIPAFFALTVIVPILGIPFLLGGVTGGEMARTSLVLLNALWLSVTAGLFSSTLSKDDRVTRTITFILVVAASIVLPLMGMRAVGAFWAWDQAQDATYKTNSDDFWIAICAQFAVACLCLGMAAWRARVLWQEKPQTERQQKVAEKWRDWSTGLADQRKLWRSVLLETNPALWLACRRRSRTALVWLFLGIGAVALVWIWQVESRIDAPVGLIFSLVFHFLMKVTIAFAAARGLSDEARTGGLELILTTELTPRQLLNGVLGGLVRSFGVALAVVVVADGVWITTGRLDNIFPRDFKTFLWMRLGFLLFDSVTLSLYALWLGIKMQRAGRAALRALLMVIVVPDVVAMLLFTLIRAREPYFWTIVFWLVWNCILISRAIGPLRRLREQASEQFAASPGRG